MHAAGLMCIKSILLICYAQFLGSCSSSMTRPRLTPHSMLSWPMSTGPNIRGRLSRPLPVCPNSFVSWFFNGSGRIGFQFVSIDRSDSFVPRITCPPSICPCPFRSLGSDATRPGRLPDCVQCAPLRGRCRRWPWRRAPATGEQLAQFAASQRARRVPS